MDQVKGQPNSDENWLEHIALHDAIEHLSEREKTILNLRLFPGKTSDGGFREIGISQAQVSRLKKNALEAHPGKTSNEPQNPAA